jgi:type I restriction enzyme M protein
MRSKPAAEKPWTEKLWIYDLRTNKHSSSNHQALARARIRAAISAGDVQKND